MSIHHYSTVYSFLYLLALRSRLIMYSRHYALTSSRIHVLHTGTLSPCHVLTSSYPRHVLTSSHRSCSYLVPYSRSHTVTLSSCFHALWTLFILCVIEFFDPSDKLWLVLGYDGATVQRYDFTQFVHAVQILFGRNFPPVVSYVGRDCIIDFLQGT
jgi:hypothetical protein